ncbi:DNA-3-methyladenine glycosylase I [Candidatus Nomurabacteria bacterium]|nr:DNA-3-methyladenine glycosylase I [Candidatus Nomurabacteria bacterium]USN94797.1 MAG: DNA-3-methyladenine glycosylase I [Candidatus Nomurabacteria bacterium]
MKNRCAWANGDDILMKEYHDKVWGRPKKNDIDIFEAIVLDTNQAGLSWSCILNKRDNFAKAFCNFDPRKISKMGESDIKKLMKNSGIIRHEGKIRATIENAKAFLQIQKEFGSAADYFWAFTSKKVIFNNFKDIKSIPSKTAISEKMSKDLKKRGFKFTGPVMCYAFMQGIGIVHDHTKDCFLYKNLKN